MNDYSYCILYTICCMSIFIFRLILLILIIYRMEKRTKFIDFIDRIQLQEKYIEYIEEENRKLKENIKWYEKEEDRLREEIRFKNNRIKELELCNLNLQTWIDNKEKVNKQLREDIGKITVHSNMLESENKLFKEELKARLERIKELEK